MIVGALPSAKHPHKQNFVLSQIESLRDIGVDIRILELGVERGWKKYVRGVFVLHKYLRESAYDIIHAHYGYCGLIARMQFSVPIVVSYMGDDILGTPDAQGKITKKSVFISWVNRLLSLTADAVIVKSQQMRSMIPKKKNVYIIPNGVDFNLFRPIDRIMARRTLGLVTDSSHKYICFGGDPSIPRKNFRLAEQVVNLLRTRFPNVELLPIYGYPQDKVVLFLNACDALLMTSFSEGSPNIVKEAMACNIPVVSVDVGDVRQQIENTYGCYVGNYDPTNLALLLSKVLLWGGRTKGREDIAYLELSKVATRVLAVYKTIHERKHVKSCVVS